MTVVQLELPQELYLQAKQVAKTKQRSVEQILVEWIRPPREHIADSEDALTGLESLSTPELAQIAQAKVAEGVSERLRSLLELQRKRTLTDSEQREAEFLVEQEDLLTLRKAKALYLLKQRNALPLPIAKIQT